MAGNATHNLSHSLGRPCQSLCVTLFNELAATKSNETPT